VGVSLGSFNGSNALAVGAVKSFANSTTSISMGFATSEKGDAGGRVSAFFKF
jgi:hypothetical protein